MRTAFLSHTILTAKGLLLNICRDFEIAHHARAGKTELFFALEDFLLQNFRKGSTALLVIDEAHHIKPNMLEEIRLLSNLETDQQKLLQILLVGQPELDARLAQRELKQLRERVTVHYLLKHLSRQETEKYINHRLQVAGYDTAGNLFQSDAVDAIYDYTGGVPRLINKICENVLLMGHVLQSRTITVGHVHKAQLRESFGDEATPFSPTTGEETESPIRSSEDDTGLVEFLKEKLPWDDEPTPAIASDGQDIFHKNGSTDMPAQGNFPLEEKLENSVTEAPIVENKSGQAAGNNQTMHVANLQSRFSIAELLHRNHGMAAKRSKLGSIVVLLVSLLALLLLGFVGVLWLLNMIGLH